MKALAQRARLAYTQFLELELFTKFGTTVEPRTQAVLERGRRIRELLKQPAHEPIPLGEQVLLLHLAQGDALLEVEVGRVREFERLFREAARERLGDLLARITGGEDVSDEDVAAITAVAEQVKDQIARRKE